MFNLLIGSVDNVYKVCKDLRSNRLRREDRTGKAEEWLLLLNP